MPVDQLQRQWANSRMAWIGQRQSSWRVEHPGANADEVSQNFTVLSNEWAAMTRAAKQIASNGLNTSTADDDDSPPSVQADDGNDDLWNTGCKEWPTRASVLGHYLDTQCGATSGGVASKASEARQRAVGSLVVPDSQSVPDSKRFEVTLSCCEMHPGLCAEKDHSIYIPAMS